MDESALRDFLEPYIEEPGVIQDYLTIVAQGPFRAFKNMAQYGNKKGEPLYTHILNGILLLEQLRHLVDLTDAEARLLFTAYTLHDINKFFEESKKSYRDLASLENAERFITEFGLDAFFPDYKRSLDVIVEVMHAHPGHYNLAARRLDLTRPFEEVAPDRLTLLIKLVRAADNLDLSHTLDEWRSHKDKFLSEFNAACKTTQYTFFTHRLAEHRGLLSNIIHNSISATLEERYHLLPLLLYPEGTAYLMEQNATVPLDDALFAAIASRVAATLQAMTSGRFEQFIVPRPLGITIDAKCLELGLPFRTLMSKVRTIIERRQTDPIELSNKIRERTERRLKDMPPADPLSAAVATLLAGSTLVPTSAERLRPAEAIRTYYIFLNEHFKATVADPWQRLYDLFGVPQDRRPLYDLFDARMDRAYVVMNDITLPSEDLWEQILTDGAALLDQRQSSDPRIPLLTEYLRQVVRFEAPQQRPAFAQHLQHYIANQHHQCVYCSSSFPTSGWMKGDVRSEISVNTFSNRLAGGPGEPKKSICGICQLQFLVEKLAFKEVRGEQIYYLHLYPYSFLPALLVNGIRQRIKRATELDENAQALFLRPEEYLARYDPTAPIEFLTQTKKGKPHTYGVYLPNYSETVGNLFIEPLNAPGDNDTERMLFVLQTAMLLQKHLGLKVLVSLSPVPPLDKEAIGDLYLDLCPLGIQGLLEDINFRSYEDGNKPGNLQPLWDRVQAILRLRKQLGVIGERDPVIELARALTIHPLEVFFVAERLLENRFSKGSSSSAFLRIKEAHDLLPDLDMLAKATKGATLVTAVSDQLKRLAEIAWANGLRGRSLEKHSIMVPFDECLNQLSHTSQAFESDEDAIRATTITEIFEYLKRIAPEGYKPGAKKQNACEEFVEVFFSGLYRGVYQGSKARLLNDERRLRAAFLFYLRKQIQAYFEARKRGGVVEDDNDPQLEGESA